MSEGWNIAVLGATGAVGSAVVSLLEEREFPVGELYLLAGERSAGESVRMNGKSYLVTEARDFDWSQVQLAFSWPVRKPPPRIMKRRQTAAVL